MEQIIRRRQSLLNKKNYLAIGTEEAKLYRMSHIKKIQMVDLQAQYTRLKTSIDREMQKVLSSSQFINGPQVKEFASHLAHFLQVKHVIPVANGTDALQIALQALEIPKNSEIIIPSFTYVATAEVAAHLGYKIRFVEVDRNFFTTLPSSIEKVINSNTKAIMPVHLYGQSAPMDEITDLAKKYNLRVVEDNAQAIGAEYCGAKMSGSTGTFGDFGTISFFPSKNLGCFGDGGAICTNDDLLAHKAKMIANHGQSKKYIHDILGVNSRLDTLQAAILLAKLPHLKDFIKVRQNTAKVYDETFNKHDELLSIPYRAPYSSHVFHQYTVKIKNGKRDFVKNKLAEKGIPSMVYYPIPLHQQKAYKNEAMVGPLNNTENLCAEVLSLPIHSEMDTQTAQFIAENVVQILKNNG